MESFPSHIIAPQAPLDDAAEFDFIPSIPRTERLPVKLESRGVTSHRSKAEVAQQEFWESLSIFAESIVAKLDTAGRSDVADLIRDCHTEVTYKRCVGCASMSKFYNRCDIWWCPLCSPRLARERRESVEWWTREVQQPKHVVLTARNAEVFTKSFVVRFKKAFARLRRLKFARNWIGGFYRLEVTNEGRGWHLHLHALIDCRYIDSRQLAIEWAKCIGQDFAIVKVKDARDKSYLAEVTKYAVKPAQLAEWSGLDVASLVDALKGVRTFGVFGSLYGKRTEWRAWLDSIQDIKHTCECGCSDFRLLSAAELLAEELQPERKSGRLALPPPSVRDLFSGHIVTNYAVGA